MKNKQGLTIAALIIAIVGLSIGFAAFSNTLTISSSASVNPDENTFNVVFSSSSNSVATTSVVPTKNAAATSANITTTNATISGRSLTNLSAEFTAPGQSVTYETNLYVYNAGQLQAQLTGITFNNATDSNTYKKCAAIEQQNESATATESLVNAACEGISIKVTIGTADDVTPTTTGDKAHLNYQMLGVGASLPAKVTISYDEGASYVDGPMSVSFGRIDINATSAIDPNQEVVPQVQRQRSAFLVSSAGEILAYDATYGQTLYGTNLTIPSTLHVSEMTGTFNISNCISQDNDQETCNDFKDAWDDDPASFLDFVSMGLIDNFQILETDSIVTITSIGNEAFGNKGLTGVNIPDSVITIKNRAFSNNNIENIRIGSGITNIGKEAFFMGKEALNPISSVVIDASAANVTIGENVFDNFNVSNICWLKDDPTCGQ